MNFRRRRGHVESPRTALTSRAERASRQASLAGRRRRTERRGERFGGVGMPTAGTGWEGRGGVRLIRAAAEGRKSERDRASERARKRDDATRRVETRAWQHGASAVRARCARRGNAAPRDPHGRRARRSYRHGRHSRVYGERRGGSEKERIPFCRAGGDEKRRAGRGGRGNERERASERRRETDERVAAARVEGEGQGGQTCGARRKERGR